MQKKLIGMTWIMMVLVLSACSLAGQDKDQRHRPRSYEDIEQRLNDYFFPNLPTDTSHVSYIVDVSYDDSFSGRIQKGLNSFIQQGNEVFFISKLYSNETGTRLYAISGADTASFWPLIDGVAIDANAYYLGTNRYPRPQEHSKMRIHQSWDYIVFDDNLYHFTLQRGFELLSGADYRALAYITTPQKNYNHTFIDSSYIRDQDQVRRRGGLVKGADPDTFEVVDYVYDNEIAKDKNAYYHRDQKITQQEFDELMKQVIQ